MTLNSPEIQTKIFQWQSELRQMMGNNHVKVQAFYPLRRYEDIETIAAIICEETKIEMDLVRRQTRKRYIVLTRHLIAYFGRKCTRLTLSEIGKFIGGADHTTVIHACSHIKDLLDTNDPEVGEYVANITTKLGERGQSVLEDNGER